MFQKWIQFVKAHELIVAVGLIVVAASWVTFAWMDRQDKKDEAQALTEHEKTLVDANSASVAEEQVVQLQKTVAQQTHEIASLKSEVLNAIATRDSSARSREQAEETDPLSTVANRWSVLVKAPDGDIQAGTDGKVLVSGSASRLTTEALEFAQSQEADYADLKKLDAGKDKQIESMNALIVSERDSARQEILLAQDQAASCKAQAKVASDVAAKRSRHSFWKGAAVGAGAVAAIVLRFL